MVSGFRSRFSVLNSSCLRNQIQITGQPIPRRPDVPINGVDGAKLAGADLGGAEVSGLNLTTLADFAGLKVSDDQMFALLDAMGVTVRARSR